MQRHVPSKSTCTVESGCCWRHPKACQRALSLPIPIDTDGCNPQPAGHCTGVRCSFGVLDWLSVPWHRHKIARQRLEWFETNGLLDRNMTSGEHSVRIRRFPNEGLGRALNTLLVDPPDPSLCGRQLCRLGPAADGGWSVCRDQHRLVRGRSCVIYSVGISNDARFDEAARALGCEQHLFDHTPQAARTGERIGRSAPGRLFFHKRGLAPRSGVARVSLPDFMAERRHTHVDVLKIDCEGCEWAVFAALAAEHSELLGRVGQLLIEVHAPPPTGSMSSAARPYPFRIQQLERFVEHVFGRHGFAVASRHLNPWNLFWNTSFDGLLPKSLRQSGAGMTAWPCWELVLLRRGQ
jgi:FkbM family methyltransferase